MRFADLDAVTVDGFGTLVELEDPVKPLAAALQVRGVQRSPRDVADAFAQEAAYYRPRSHLARDPAALERLRRECVTVFLDALEAPLGPDEFVDAFMEALVFRPADNAVEALRVLRDQKLRLAVVSNWDCSLPERLDWFDTVVSSAEAGVPKPEPGPFLLALERLETAPGRTLHVGDEPADEQGARAVGMRFAPAPLSSVVEALA